jgi:hypothetical protein
MFIIMNLMDMDLDLEILVTEVQALEDQVSEVLQVTEFLVDIVDHQVMESQADLEAHPDMDHQDMEFQEVMGMEVL